MRCFYCGRPLRELTSTNEKATGIKGTAYMLTCAYPRCKMRPASDWEASLELCEIDIDMIKKSVKGY